MREMPGGVVKPRGTGSQGNDWPLPSMLRGVATSWPQNWPLIAPRTSCRVRTRSGTIGMAGVGPRAIKPWARLSAAQMHLS